MSNFGFLRVEWPELFESATKAEAAVETGEPLPLPDPSVSDPEMDIEEPIYLHLVASTEVREVPAGAVS